MNDLSSIDDTMITALREFARSTSLTTDALRKVMKSFELLRPALKSEQAVYVIQEEP